MSVTLTVATVKLPLAVGQYLTDWVFIVSANGAQVARQDVPIPTVAFTDLPPGDYSATAQRFDSGGNAFGAQVSANFTIPNIINGEPVASEAVAAADQMLGDAAGSMTVLLT